jgi:DmsE family decaheme c-type cytochrome
MNEPSYRRGARGLLTASVLAGAFIGGFALWAASAPVAAAPQESAAAATSIGGACAECHTDEVAAIAKAPHSVLDTKGWASRADASGSCTACHGEGLEHIEEAGEAPIFTFTDEHTAIAKSERCLTCHSSTHPRFRLSSHAKAGLDCTSCHAVHDADFKPGQHAGPELAGRPSAVCSECHGEVLAEFAFTEHHRLEEGTVECSSCHDPHAPATRVQLGAFKQQQCGNCHTDKNGPFIFEHGSIRVEGCVACHTPHGAPNRHQLAFQDVAELCLSCHAILPGFHSRFSLETRCTNCHSSIHGSNLDPKFLK